MKIKNTQIKRKLLFRKSECKFSCKKQKLNNPFKKGFHNEMNKLKWKVDDELEDDSQDKLGNILL